MEALTREQLLHKDTPPLLILLYIAFVVPLALWLYLSVGGLVARWWEEQRIQRSAAQGKSLDSIERAYVKSDAVVIGVLWPGTFPVFMIMWSFVGRSIARFGLWAWRFAIPKLPEAKIVSREKKPH